jgi:LemA protein
MISPGMIPAFDLIHILFFRQSATLQRSYQMVDAQWGQVVNVYQRRADLVPNLVETVKGAAAFEKSTFLAVTEARAKVGQINTGGKTPASPASRR